jgi:tetratricopeptide (TPR) repeat protein
LLAESYRRDRSDLDAFFELGQAEYWIGMIYRELGALDATEVSFTAYAEITRQLIVLQPENAEWVLEMAFALTNLGALQMKRDANKPERVLQLLQSALEYNQIALVLDPQNNYYQSELGQSHAFLADAQREVCDLEGALQSRKKQLSLEREQWSADQESIDRKRRLATAYSGYAVVQKELAQIDGAIDSLENALNLMGSVLLESPETQFNTRLVLYINHSLVMFKSLDGDTDQAWGALEELDQEWQKFLQREGAQDENIKFHVDFLLSRAWLAQSRGATESALKLLAEAQQEITGLLEKLPEDRTAGNLLTRTVFQRWELTQELPSESVMRLLPAYNSYAGHTRACTDASQAAKKAVMLGDTARAGELTAYLVDKGYTEVSFVRFCKAYSLCKGQ